MMGIGHRIGCKIVRSCRRSIFVSDRESYHLHPICMQIGWRIEQRIGCENVRVYGPLTRLLRGQNLHNDSPIYSYDNDMPNRFTKVDMFFLFHFQCYCFVFYHFLWLPATATKASICIASRQPLFNQAPIIEYPLSSWSPQKGSE
jgi:hypothetical protein